MPSHLLKLKYVKAVTKASHCGQRGGFEQQEVLVQWRGIVASRQALNAMYQVSVLILRLGHHLHNTTNLLEDR